MLFPSIALLQYSIFPHCGRNKGNILSSIFCSSQKQSEPPIERHRSQCLEPEVLLTIDARGEQNEPASLVKGKRKHKGKKERFFFDESEKGVIKLAKISKLQINPTFLSAHLLAHVCGCGGGGGVQTFFPSLSCFVCVLNYKGLSVQRSCSAMDAAGCCCWW